MERKLILEAVSKKVITVLGWSAAGGLIKISHYSFLNGPNATTR
jgi:hypothetical protein